MKTLRNQNADFCGTGCLELSQTEFCQRWKINIQNHGHHAPKSGFQLSYIWMSGIRWMIDLSQNMRLTTCQEMVISFYVEGACQRWGASMRGWGAVCEPNLIFNAMGDKLRPPGSTYPVMSCNVKYASHHGSWNMVTVMCHLDGAAAEQLAQPCPGGETLPDGCGKAIVTDTRSCLEKKTPLKIHLKKIYVITSPPKRMFQKLGKRNFFWIGFNNLEGSDAILLLWDTTGHVKHEALWLWWRADITSRAHESISCKILRAAKKWEKHHFETCYKVDPYQL